MNNIVSTNDCINIKLINYRILINININLYPNDFHLFK